MGSSTTESANGPSWGLFEAARQIGNLAWFERRMFEVLSSWSTDDAEADVAVAFAEQARHRAWHSELWFARLPELRELDADSQVVPAGPEVEAFCDHLLEVADPPGRLAVLARVVLPHQVAVLAGLRARCRPAADRSLLRTVELVRRDLHEHWESSSVLLAERLSGRGEGSGEVIAAVTAAQGAAETRLLSAGGPLGRLDA